MAGSDGDSRTRRRNPAGILRQAIAAALGLALGVAQAQVEDAAPASDSATAASLPAEVASSAAPLQLESAAADATGESPAVAPEPAAPQSVALDEVIVTANKREETARDVPETIQAFSGDKLEAAGVQTAKDLARITPNLSFIEAQQPGVVLINVRGIGQLRMGEAPVAVVIDGVQSSIPNEITQDLFDVERMEVLKGPQGSIYGRNAIGGAINVVTRQPTNDFEGRINLTQGNGGDQRVGAQFSGPIVKDRLMFRIAGKLREFDGLINDQTINEKVDDEHARSARASLTFLPNDDFIFTLTGNYDDIRAGASYYVPYSLLRGVGADPDISDPKPVVEDHKGLGTRRIENVSLKADWTTGIGTLSSITAYAHLHSFLDEELDWTPLPLLTATQIVNNRATSQELRLVSPNDDTFQWLAGLYYLNVARRTGTAPFVGAAFTDALGLPGIQDQSKRYTDGNNSYAAFANGSYRFTEHLQLTLGARYDIEDRSELNLVNDSQVGATFRSLQPKVSLSYDFDGPVTYVTVGKGFRSGGFNPTDQVGREYKSESVLSYELGLKTPFLGNRGSLNLAGFYTHIKDRQVYTLNLLTVSQLIANPIPKAHVYGGELELSLRPLPFLFVGGGLGLLRSRIDSYDPRVYAGTAAQGNFNGNQLNQVPGISYNAVIEYTQPIDGLTVVAHADFNGSGGDYYWEINNNDKRAPQNFTNARLTLKSEHWSLAGFVDNAFNERYVVEYVPYQFSGGLSNLGLPGRPRRFGAELGYNF